ncbi:MAG: PD40 domain-containing protein, partial [Acidobacteriaceae bacterium]|nr:PD40 domain-containing protein [Acidobacteriaceae bacterium]
TRAGNAIWIETASEGVPRSARITSSPNCAIDNAETPSLSADGSILAFVREDHGRGSLWVVDTRRCNDPATVHPVRITPPEFDVRSMSPGANNTFLISSVYGGLERVFAVKPGESPRLLAEAGAPLDSPSLSPDGKAIALRELIAERWQLMLLNLSSRTWKQLTYGDCNAYTPSWQDNRTLLYATDCMRGIGFSTLASLQVDR